MKEIKFDRDGFTFLINNYKDIGAKIEGISSDKIFLDNEQYYKNHNGRLLKLIDYKILQNNVEIDRSAYVFDTNVRVAALMAYETKILLIHRIKDGKEYYVYPGGHVKDDEELTSALVREIKEETNIDIGDANPKLIEDSSRPGFGPEKFYLVELSEADFNMNNTNPEDSHGLSELVWFEIENAKKLTNLYPAGLINKLSNE